MSFCLSKRLGHHGIISSLSSSFTPETRCLMRRRAGSCRAIAWAGRYAAARSARPTSTTSRSPPKALSSIFGARRPKLPILSTYPRHNSGLHVSYREARVVRLLLNRLLCVSLIMPSSASAALYAKFGLSPNDEGDYRKVLATIPTCANADRSIPDVEHIHVTAKRDVDRMLHAFNRDVVCRIDKEAQRTSVDPSNDGLSA